MKLKVTICFFLMPLFANGQVFSKINNPDTLENRQSGQVKDIIDEQLITGYSFDEQASFKRLFPNSDPLFLSLIANMKLWNYPERDIRSQQRTVFVNGLAWNLSEDNKAPMNALSALYGNAQIESSYGLDLKRFPLGGLNGSSSFTINPLRWSKSYLAAVEFSNGNNRNALKFQYHTGLMKNGWAAGFSLNQRWTIEGYTPGTSVHSTSFLATIGKSLPKQQEVSLTIFGNAVQQSFPSAITNETATLSGVFQYNPNWGYQHGRIRNALVLHSFKPAVLLSYHVDFTKKTNLNVSISFQSGKEGVATLDWFHAYNPRPDYYRNLPSYYNLQGGILNSQTGNYLSSHWQKQGFQINWDGLFEANRVNKFSALNGQLQPSLYVLSEDKSHSSVFRGAAAMEHHFSKSFQIKGGLQYELSRSENYRELADLLGGNYFVNLNQFAFQSYGQQPGWEQFDLLHPNRKVKSGDKYYYDYLSKTQQGRLFLKGDFQTSRLKLSLGASIASTFFQRIGYYQNGIFPDDSYGQSEWVPFYTFQVNGGIQYSFQSNHQIWLSALAGSETPTFNHTFFTPRIRNATVKGISPEMITAIEMGWTIHRKTWQAAFTVFNSEIKNQTDVLQFYHDDYKTYVHLVLEDAGTAQTGIELAGSFSAFQFLDINILASWMQAFYNARPAMTLIKDNDTTTIFGRQIVYWKNYFAVSGPQSLLGLELRFHHPHWGYLNISGSWQDRNYVTLNPARYTETAVYLLQKDDERRALILEQEKLPAYFLAQIEAGRQFKFRKNKSEFLRKSSWYLSVGIQNLLNYQGYRTSGAEQLRFDYNQQDPSYFPNKYRFGTGRILYASLQYRGW